MRRPFLPTPALGLALAALTSLSVGGCGAGGSGTGDGDDGTAPFGITVDVVFPDAPADLDVPEPVGVPGQPMAADHLNTEKAWLWCDTSDAGADPVALLVVGDIWSTGEGAGLVAEIDTGQHRAGETLSVPTAETAVVFLVDLHGQAGIPTEYASAEEESSGSIVLEALPCSEAGGDELVLRIDGAIGAETNPGFQAAADITATIRISETGPPPASEQIPI